MSFWDQQFAGEAFKYGERPNVFLVSQSSRLQARGRVLLPGDGEGRNSVWLAEQGHAVVALDQSRVGLDKARRLALSRQVHIDTVLAEPQTGWVVHSGGVSPQAGGSQQRWPEAA